MTRYIRKSRTISGKLHDEMVMMDLEQGKYFSLNQVATRIWELLEKPIEVEALCKLLMEEYGVEKEQCLSEVMELLAELKRLNLAEELTLD